MGGVRQVIVKMLQGIGTQSLTGGFWTDEQGNLLEDYVGGEEEWMQEMAEPIGDEWRDEQGNLLRNYTGNYETEMGEMDCGIQPQEHKDAVSAGDIRDTAQRGGA